MEIGRKRQHFLDVLRVENGQGTSDAINFKYTENIMLQDDVDATEAVYTTILELVIDDLYLSKHPSIGTPDQAKKKQRL
ncbi:hypothetical protein DCC81_20615 [Chitinophaga parva]|uniref:Uncharacterized protein n=1 Tax=Chitinophaga parva TaxID=2169414 RepID=A0A2T7BCM3_9BACT|nr:hypothetical protein DCC81_20615 [Chitinophaga parva]